MRVGHNPFKDEVLPKTEFWHQVIIPVYIPKQEGYFKDSFKILKKCIESILQTTHLLTYISVVNNGSCIEVREYLNSLKEEGKVNELINTSNIGKINSINKGLTGHNFPFVTISDADVLFLPGWQQETMYVFKNFPKAGVVGLIPQFLTYQNNCENLIFDYFWKKNLYFIEVKNPEALASFYKSIGWKSDYPKERLKYTMGLKANNGYTAGVGSGHVVATYKKELFDGGFPLYNPYKMGGGSMNMLDELPMKKGYYRLTTYDNYAFHMGNVGENWMSETVVDLERSREKITLKPFLISQKSSKVVFQFKRILIQKMIKSHKLRMLFLKYKSLPKEARQAF